jgi:hypothetical protein
VKPKAKALSKLLTAVYLYPNYRVDSRGPAGCILDAIEALAPEIGKALREEGFDVARNFLDDNLCLLPKRVRTLHWIGPTLVDEAGRTAAFVKPNDIGFEWFFVGLPDSENTTEGSIRGSSCTQKGARRGAQKAVERFGYVVKKD